MKFDSARGLEEPSFTLLARLAGITAKVNLPVAFLVFLLFLAGQTGCLTTLMDPPLHADLPQFTFLWIGTMLHSVLAMLVVMLVAGLVGPLLPKGVRALLWSGILIAATGLVWDFIGYQLVRQHLFHALQLFRENMFVDVQMMQSRRVPLLLVVGGYFALLAGGAGVFYWKEARWGLLRWQTRCGSLALASGMALLLALAYDRGLRQVVPPQLYQASLRSNLSVARLVGRELPPADALFQIRSPHFRPPPRIDKIDLGIRTTPGKFPPGKLPDIFFFVIESFRRDCATLENTPHLKAFSSRCLTIDKTVANANQTHFSLTAILHGIHPFYFGTFVNRNDAPGALPLRVLKKLGYKVKVFASPDLQFFRFASLTFGRNNELADFYLDQKKIRQLGYTGNPAAIDNYTVHQLAASLAEPSDGPSFYFIMLDSSHIDYYWGEEFQPRFVPYSPRVKVVPLGFDQTQIERLRNRYKNSLAYVDQLMGEALAALDRHNRLSSSIVVVTGDHGEEFLERGHMVHGGEPNHFQLDVPLWIQIPGLSEQVLSRRYPMASHVDIFPTVFDFLGLNGEFKTALSGKSILSASPPLWALCVQHPGPLPSTVVLDLGKEKLWLDLIDAERVGKLVTAQYLVGARMLQADDVSVAPGSQTARGKVPIRFLPALRDLIALP